MKRKNTRLAAILAVIAVVVAGFGAAARPANAAFSPYVSGSTGPWLGTSSWTNCYSASAFISSSSPLVGRAPTYTSIVQTIWMLPVLERFDFATGKWTAYLQGTWQSAKANPGQNVQFSSQRFTNLAKGNYYRTGYLFKWYVGSSKLGESLTYNHKAEYYQSYTTINPSQGDFCYV